MLINFFLKIGVYVCMYTRVHVHIHTHIFKKDEQNDTSFRGFFTPAAETIGHWFV